jgi:chromosome segregation ATPase
MKSKITLAAAALALMLGMNAQAVDNKAINDQHKAAMDKCKDLKGNAKDICKAEADGQKKVAKAEAELKENDTPKNRFKVDEAKAKAQYDVAKEKCDDLKGDAKSACKKAAKAERDGAIAQAKKAQASEPKPAKEEKKKG